MTDLLATVTFRPMILTSRTAAIGAAVAVVLAATIMLTLGVPRSEARARSCGHIRVEDNRFRVTIERGKVRCRKAREVFRIYLSGGGERHEGKDSAHTYVVIGRWRCGAGTGGGGCIRKGKSFRTARDYIIAQS